MHEELIVSGIGLFFLIEVMGVLAYMSGSGAQEALVLLLTGLIIAFKGRIG
jgi:hypothetical protein